MKEHSIKKRIFILQLILILVPLLMLKYDEFNNTKQQIEAKQLKTLQLKTDHVGEVLEQYREEVRTYALIFAQNGELQESLNGMKDISGWDYKDTSNVMNYPNEDWGTIGGPYNESLVRLRDFSRNAFQTLHEEHEYVGNIEVMNKNMVVVMRGHRDKRGDTKEDSLIKDAVDGMSRSGFLVSKRTGQPAIDGTAPIRREGEIVGGIKVGMYLTERVIRDIQEKTGVNVLVSDGNKIVMISGFDKGKLSTVKMDDRHNLDIFNHVEKDDKGQCTVMKDEIYKDYILKGKEYIKLYSDFDEQSYATQIVPIDDYAGTTIGSYLVAIDNSDMVMEIERERNGIIARFMMIFMFSIIVSYIFSHQIGDPIMRFTKQIISMRKSDGLKKVDFKKGPVELMKMAYEFNVLVDNLNFHKSKNLQLQEMNSLDGLTNLLNHRCFHQDISELSYEGCQMSMIFFDLDRFKSINDTLGHSVGDIVLREIGKILKSFEKDEEIKAYRYGGEEFAMICKGVQKDDAYLVSETIRIEIMNSKRLQMMARELKVTISAGVASYKEDAETVSELVENADYAMYYSKKNGRNKTTLYSANVREFFNDNSEDMLQRNSYLNAVNMISNALEARDEYTGQHSKQVMIYSERIAKAMGLDDKTIEKLKFASLLHDSGKIGVSDKVLLKRGKLTPDEYFEMKRHPEIGYNIVKNISTDKQINEGILHHHERWDGTGYPSGLEGKRIPLIARIIAVADSFQAMTSDRTYRNALSVEDALDEIRKNKGVLYDPQIVERFLAIMDGEEVFTEFERKDADDHARYDLKKSDELDMLGETFNASMVNIVILDKEHRILFANEAKQKMLNKHCYSAIRGSNEPCEGCKLQEAFESKEMQINLKHEIMVNGDVQEMVQIWIPISEADDEAGRMLEIAFPFNHVLDYVSELKR